MSRTFEQITELPQSGNVVEIREPIPNTDDTIEITLRVIAVREDWVWFKQYGKGMLLLPLQRWRGRLQLALAGRVLFGGEDG